jgi:hypothetical protein
MPISDATRDALERALADPAALADLRARFDAELLEEHGPEWYAAHRATLDADWAAAVALFGGEVRPTREVPR